MKLYFIDSKLLDVGNSEKVILVFILTFNSYLLVRNFRKVFFWLLEECEEI